ncbi:hypothetical protein PF004_g25914 [Phytophthora fragariae]|uniref:Uncharacterized protein n=1 Tax=Phytophthora fragariae TaxID=53985 RepID=A0A6G0MQP5_9STRA|nr:hypothetical protein PF003_g40668 [Phytophthora fragariae]KAE9176943.1 hypothetical protein PF004_g25914 [Phytophthora fragariae]
MHDVGSYMTGMLFDGEYAKRAGVDAVLGEEGGGVHKWLTPGQEVKKQEVETPAEPEEEKAATEEKVTPRPGRKLPRLKKRLLRLKMSPQAEVEDSKKDETTKAEETPEEEKRKGKKVYVVATEKTYNIYFFESDVVLAALALTTSSSSTTPRSEARYREVYWGEGKSSFYEVKGFDMEKKAVSIEEYKGKVVLVANVSSKCSLTPRTTRSCSTESLR